MSVNLPWLMGSAVAWGDYDNDGDLDLFIINSGAAGGRDFSIYKNERNGCFVEMPGFTYGEIMLSSWADIDNDGDVDLFTGLLNLQLRHWVNDGYGNYKIKGYVILKYLIYYP